MSKPTRRTFLKQTGTGLAGLTALNWNNLAIGAPAASEDIPDSLRPQPLVVPGIHAYTNEQSVSAGNTISFCVSSTHPYELSVCRLGTEVDGVAGDETIHRFEDAPAQTQPLYPGSFVHVAKGLRSRIYGLSLECWVRPLKEGVWTGLMSQYDFPDNCGYGLFINEEEGIRIYLGDGKEFRPEFAHDTPGGLVKVGEWNHVVATFDGINILVWVNGAKAGAWNFFPSHPTVKAGSSSLRLGAASEDGRTAQFLDGDLARPTIYRRALTEGEIVRRYNEKGIEEAKGNDVLAGWNLSEEKGERVRDSSGNGRHGQIINHGTWMIGGPSFDADVPRFSDYNPQDDSSRGHGLRLASDDLYDCGWRTTHQIQIPKSAKPGFYVGRFRYMVDGVEHNYHATFVVKRYKRRKRTPLLVLCNSNTWRAYNGTPFGINSPELNKVWGTQGPENSEGDPPAFNFYKSHVAGQATYQMGRKIPCPAADPYLLYSKETDYSHLVRAERFTHAWLESNGYDFDVITDLDLHQNPSELKKYKTLLVAGHSEYWSANMYQGVENFLARGGNLVSLAGNSVFWRVSFDKEASVMECRKVDAPGHQVPTERRGESWHSHDSQRGGLMRECGYPGWKITGLETLGWNNQADPAQFGPYQVDLASHFLFNSPNKTGVSNGDPIGQGKDGNLPRANGHEIDVRPSTLRGLQTEADPVGRQVPKDPTGMIRLANGQIDWEKGGSAFDYYLRPIQPDTKQGGEMVYWERPEGGKVFNTGSIGTGWALNADPRLQKLLVNVLTHFGVTKA